MHWAKGRLASRQAPVRANQIDVSPADQEPRRTTKNKNGPALSGRIMLCEAGSARLFILMGCLTAAHFPVHMRAHSGGRTQSCPFSILWIELSRALGP